MVMVDRGMIVVVIVVVMTVGWGGFNSCGHGWIDSGGDRDCGDSYGKGNDDEFPS